MNEDSKFKRYLDELDAKVEVAVAKAEESRAYGPPPSIESTHPGGKPPPTGSGTIVPIRPPKPERSPGVDVEYAKLVGRLIYTPLFLIMVVAAAWALVQIPVRTDSVAGSLATRPNALGFGLSTAGRPPAPVPHVEIAEPTQILATRDDVADTPANRSLDGQSVAKRVFLKPAYTPARLTIGAEPEPSPEVAPQSRDIRSDGYRARRRDTLWDLAPLYGCHAAPDRLAWIAEVVRTSDLPRPELLPVNHLIRGPEPEFYLKRCLKPAARGGATW